MLGSAMDAEDMVQETYLRYQTTPPETIRSLKAFLTTILTRLCMDQLQLARRKREVYVGPWLPEPILTTTTPASEDPAERVEREESRSEEHTSELQSRLHLVCRLLLEKKKNTIMTTYCHRQK